MNFMSKGIHLNDAEAARFLFRMDKLPDLKIGGMDPMKAIPENVKRVHHLVYH
jgi:hypothetical protein